KDLDEPMESQQIGSSAMAYKRNPMRSERMCGLARFVMSLATNPPYTAATQWMERTLDDSANRRLVIPQAFLAVDAILMLYHNIAAGLVVYPRVMRRALDEELPFMVTERLLMAAVARGADRQSVHAIIRRHSLEAARRVKEEALPNDLFARLATESVFDGMDWESITDVHALTGRSGRQVTEFIDEHVTPLRDRYRGEIVPASEVRV
ncbi:MAG TPA: adenylosuccinate lyase, partial [Pirellulaceae bacterium]